MKSILVCRDGQDYLFDRMCAYFLLTNTIHSLYMRTYVWFWSTLITGGHGRRVPCYVPCYKYCTYTVFLLHIVHTLFPCYTPCYKYRTYTFPATHPATNITHTLFPCYTLCYKYRTYTVSLLHTLLQISHIHCFPATHPATNIVHTLYIRTNVWVWPYV
jgi:hypothetical protein